MPNPKRRHSRARRNKRRAHDHLVPPGARLCDECSAVIMPHRACRFCGHYKGREVIEVDSD